jgi:hypothetical protein
LRQKPFFFDTIQGKLYSQHAKQEASHVDETLPIPEIPAETVRVVRAVFPKGNIYTHLRDTLGTIYQDGLFEDLYPDRGKPVYTPWCLALVTACGLHGESDRSTGG